jgi:hypothetical protein
MFLFQFLSIVNTLILWSEYAILASGVDFSIPLAFLEVSSAHSIVSRIKRGKCSEIEVDEEGFLVKTEAGDSEDGFIQNEFRMLAALQDSEIVPTLADPDDSYGEATQDGILRMELLDSAATLGDYINSWVQGDISNSAIDGVFSSVFDLIKTMEDYNLIHGDFHVNNVVIDLNEEAQFQAFIIDLATSYFDDEDPPFDQPYSSLEEDLGYLRYNICDIFGDNPELNHLIGKYL